MLTKMAKSDFGELDTVGKKMIWDRLYSLRDNGLESGNWKRFSNMPAVIELKEGPYRVYMTTVGELDYKILRIGHKNRQKEAINWLSKIRF